MKNVMYLFARCDLGLYSEDGRWLSCQDASGIMGYKAAKIVTNAFNNEVKFSGRRIKRGLYRHYDNSLSNADINGAANIMRKVFPKVVQWDSGCVDHPKMVTVV